MAKNNVIELDDVKNAYKKLDSDKIAMILDSITYHQKYLLASIVMYSLFKKKEFYSTQEIYDEYKETIFHTPVCPLSYRRAFDLLADLENTGIIVSKTRSSGRHGYHNFYKLTCDYRLVGQQIGKE